MVPLKGKIPYDYQAGHLMRNWQSQKFNPNFDSGENNFGVVLQETDLVVDIDPRNFEEGDSPVRRLVDDIGETLTSFTVKTGGGGAHVYYKLPADVVIRENILNADRKNVYPGIEFKSKGRQVVGWGSIHPDTGKMYEHQYGSLSEVAPIPTGLLELLRSTVTHDAPGLEDYCDDEQSITRFSAFLVTQAEPAVEGQGGDQQTFKIACRGRDFGLSPEKTFDLMARLWNTSCQPPWDMDELRGKVYNAYRYNKDSAGIKHPSAEFSNLDEVEPDPVEDNVGWDLDGNDRIKANLQNAVNFFLLKTSPLKDLFKLNLFTMDVEFTRIAPWQNEVKDKSQMNWSDANAVHCKYFIAKKWGVDFSINILHEAATVVSHRNRYHPVRDYLESIEWDGVPRVARWLVDYTGAADTPYVRAIGRKTLIAAVARIYRPGVKFDHILVLEGKQGTGKSTLCRYLAGDWFGDMVVDPHNKDTIDAMRGKWIIEASEMEVSRRAETQALKAFITRQTDRVRLAYARVTTDFPRQSIFIGTTNPEVEGGYLKDTTGNRRFWPVLTDRIKLDDIKANRDQLWAEAVDMFKCGEALYLTDKGVILEAEIQAAQRRMSDPWTPVIDDWLHSPDDSGALRTVVTVQDIWEECLYNPIKTLGKKEQIRIAQLMESELGWTKGVYYSPTKKKSVRGFKRIVTNLSEL